MHLPRLASFLRARLQPAREADVAIGGRDNPYLLRWHLIPRNRFLNVYLHHFLRSDDDRALHDHPWASLSLALEGRAIEHDANGLKVITAGRVRYRAAKYAHRMALEPGESAWTLFITGPRVREWGFLCPQGWRSWRVFTNPVDGGTTVGRGCD